MKNYLLMVCGLALTIGVCVAVIHYEADQTRDAMRDMAHDELTKGVRDGIERTVDKATGGVSDLGKVIGKVESTLENAAGTPAGSLPKSLPEAADSAGEVAGDLLGRIRDTIGGTSSSGATPADPGKTPPGEDPKSKPSAPSDPGSGKPDADSKAGPRPEPRDPASIVDGLFDVVRGVTKAGDQMGQQMLKLSPAEERQWGKTLHEQLVSEVKIVRKPALTRRIERLAAPLLSARRRRSIDYTFTVIDSKLDDINAFSTVGGYIYLHSALIDFVKNDQELQFVLGHEIGHVDLGHCTQQLTYTARAAEVATPDAAHVVGILHALVSRPFSKDDEFAADAYGFKAVIAAGQTREQALEFPRRMGQWMIDHGFEEPVEEHPERTVASVLVSRAQDHFHSHPPMAERLRRLEAINVGPHEKK